MTTTVASWKTEGKGAAEGALQYLNSAAAKQQPFFMVISLVNPHDVLFYPEAFAKSGYEEEEDKEGKEWLEGEIRSPATALEDLSTKPSVQEEFRNLMNRFGGEIDTPRSDAPTSTSTAT